MGKAYEALRRAGNSTAAGLKQAMVLPTANDIFGEAASKQERDLQQLRLRLDSEHDKGALKTVVFGGCVRDSSAARIACQLAETIARESSGKRVLLIDADIFQPEAHWYFQLGNESGILDILGEAASDKKATFAIEGTGLSVIPAGRWTPETRGLLHTERFKQFLDNAAKKFDWIIVIAPAFTGSAEAAAIARAADGTVVAVPQGRVKWQALAALKRELEEKGARILGGMMTQRRYFIPPVVYKFL